MKTFIFLLCTTVFGLTTETTFSQEQVTIDTDKEVSVDEVFYIIQTQTKYRFLYPQDLFENTPKVKLKKGTILLSSLLEKSLSGSDVNFQFSEKNTIVIEVNNDSSKSVKRINQQRLEIRGTVVDESGQPLLGANVMEKGASNGTLTDFDGNYVLSVSGSEAVLVVSYIGYTTQEIQVNSKTNLNIVLQANTSELDEVVLVGYGTQKKATLTGSISHVSGKEVISTAANVTASLQGRLPGLTATQRSGEPGGDDPSILIRATATLGDNAPLIIIDGVERSGIGQLNPEDVESFSVLKGATAAIYGARSANGVILITTKSGKKGKPVFSVSVNTAISNPTQKSDVLGSPLYAQVYNEGQFYDQGRPDTYTPYYSDEVIDKFRNGSERELYPDTDWVDEVLKDNAIQNRVNLEVAGGTDNTRYLMSFAALTQEGNYINNPTNYKQYNMRTKFDVDLTDNLTVGANISAIIKNKEFSSQGVGTNFINILLASPTQVAVYDNGLVAPGRFGESPLLLDRRGYNHTDEIPIYTTFTATYKVPFVEGLRIDASYNFDLDTRTSKTWNLPYTSNKYNVVTGNYDVESVGIATPELTERYDKLTTSLFNYRFTYDKTFGDHSITAMIGQEQQINKSSWIQAFRKNYVSPSIAEINVGSNAADDKDNGGSSEESSYNNYFGRLNYDFSSKYMADFVLRIDGSQNFPTEIRYGTFYAVSGAWRLSEENFIKENFSNIDQLKLRISHGLSGNDSVGPYQHLQSYNFGSNYVFGTGDVPGVNEGNLANPNITWEKARKTDIGLETSFWNGLFAADLTLWKEHRYDILIDEAPVVPNILGLPGFPDVNSGIVDSYGYELMLSHRNMNNELKYNITGNVAYANSEVIYMNETPPAEDYQSQTGMMVGSGLYYETDGIYNTQEELDGSVHHASTQVGDVKIVDVNGDGSITDADRIRYKNTSTPKYVFGMNFGFDYKNFDLNLFFQGQAAAVNYDSRYANLGASNFENGFVLRAEDRWTVDNINGTNPRSRGYVPGDNTFFLQDASFVRLKSAELGYTLPEKLLSKAGLTSTRFYVNGSNLLTWAKEIKHVDPEISGSSNYYPQVRVINVGVNFKF